MTRNARHSIHVAACSKQIMTTGESLVKKYQMLLRKTCTVWLIAMSLSVLQSGAPGRDFSCRQACAEEISLIELARFVAWPGDGTVTLLWDTDAEIDTAGFHIYRADRKDGEYRVITTAMVAAEGSPDSSASYSWVDDTVQNRHIYWYCLEEVDIDGLSTRHDPVVTLPLAIFRFFPVPDEAGM